MNPPPDKKRRTGDNDDNLWDDDDDDDLLLTQENIDTLMQSQVIGPVSDDKMTVESNLPKPVTTFRTVGRGTVKSRSSSDLVTQPYAAATSEDRTKFVHGSAGQTSANTDALQLKAENARLQKQLTDMQMISQGRIKILQEKLSQKESEIQKLRQERVDQLNQAVKDQSEMEKCWQSKLEKLNSELQFTKHELNEAIQKHATPPRKCMKPKPTTQQSTSSDKQGYDFSGDFIPPQKLNTSKVKKDAVTQVSLSAVANKSPVPMPDFKLKVKKSKGHISGSYLLHKVLKIQVPLKQLHNKPVNLGSAVIDTTCKPELESCQTSLETISSSYSSTDSSALSSAYTRLQQANILLMRTLSSLHQTSRHQHQDLLQSDMDSVTLLLPTVAESINTYTTVLSSLSFSITSHSGSLSSTVDSSASTDTQASADSSLPRGFSAKYFQSMRQQVYVALCVLKILVTYSIPVRKMLIQQVCPDFAAKQPQDESSQESAHLETSGCCLLKKLCHLSNLKLHDGVNVSTQLSFLTLDILATTLQCCPASYLERLFDNLPISDVILSCMSEHIEDTLSRFRLGCGVLQLVHTLVRSEEVIRKMCTKSADCIFYNVYSFCVQSMNDQPESRYIAHYSKLLQILASLLRADRGNSAILTSVDCNCGEVANQLVSILHHIYLSGCYIDSLRTLALLHQGSCILQNLTSLDKDFVQNHETNYQYVEFVYGMDTLYKTLLQGTEPVTVDLLLELRHDFYGDEEETDESHDFGGDASSQPQTTAHEADSFSLNPANHSTPIQAAGVNRTRNDDETYNSADSRQANKLKLSAGKRS